MKVDPSILKNQSRCWGWQDKCGRSIRLSYENENHLVGIIGWTLVWLICLRIVKSFLAGIASVAVVSVFEDFLYLTYAFVLGERLGKEQSGER